MIRHLLCVWLGHDTRPADLTEWLRCRRCGTFVWKRLTERIR